MLRFLTKLFDGNARELKNLEPVVAEVNALEVMSLALSASKKLGAAGADAVHVEAIDDAGARTVLPLSF